MYVYILVVHYGIAAVKMFPIAPNDSARKFLLTLYFLWQLKREREFFCSFLFFLSEDF